MESLNLFLVKKAVKFRNLQISKIFNIDINRTFAIPFKIMYISLKQSLRNNFVVNMHPVTCMGKIKNFPQQMLLLFQSRIKSRLFGLYLFFAFICVSYTRFGGIYSLHFAFEIMYYSEMRNLCCRLLFY